MNANPAQLWQAAQARLARGDAGGAREQLHALLRIAPDFAHAHLLLGGIAHAGGDLRAATRHAVDAARSLPPDPATISHAINALVMVGEMARVRELLGHPALGACRDPVVLSQLAGAAQMLGEHAWALALLDRALGAGPDHGELRYARAVQLMFNGRLDEAAEAFRACLRAQVAPGRAAVALARLRRQTRDDDTLALIDANLGRVAPDSEDRAAFEFARYKTLEDIGELDDAWAALERGNAIMAARLPVDAATDRQRIDQLIARCDGDFVARVAPPLDGPQPVFVVGMPRSGTTVLERLLGNHSQVTSAGELGDFARQLRWAANCVTTLPVEPAITARAAALDYAEIGRRYLAQTQWRADGRRFYVDKLPINHLNVGYIHRALPGARILHMAREPMDVCFSNWRAFFGEGYAYSYRRDALAAHHADYARLMRHWHTVLPGAVLDVSYQALVDDPEAEARRVFDFLGLPFEAGTSALERNAAPAATLSTMQVREGIHHRARAEWQRYGERFAGFADSLATA